VDLGLSPFAPEAAAFDGLTYARSIPRWRAAGYHVKLIFLELPSVELALARIRARVAQGGHNVPEDVVRRRFGRGLRNFMQVYRGLVNAWVLHDNSGPAPKLVSSGDNS
jgi:predicted ABC-type ATPase